MKKCNLNFFRHLYHKDFVSGFIKIEPFSCCGLGYDPNLVGAYFLRSFSLHSELSYALHKLNVLWEFWRLFIHNGVKFTQIFLCFNFFFQVSSDTQTPFFSTFFYTCVAFLFLKSSKLLKSYTSHFKQLWNKIVEFIFSERNWIITFFLFWLRWIFFTQKLDKVY